MQHAVESWRDDLVGYREAKLRLAERSQRELTAAVKLQLWWRGSLATRLALAELFRLRQRRTNAERVEAERRAKRDAEDQYNAATACQAIFRGRAARSARDAEVARRLGIRVDAASTLCNFARNWRARRYLKRLKARARRLAREAAKKRERELAERLAAHQNQKEEEDRPLTEDEELAKRMAERSWAERQEEPEGLKRIKRMGKQMAPDRTSAHLAGRFGARLALLEAFRDARKQQIAKGKATPMTSTSTVATMEATMSDHQKAQIWRFFNSQTQMGLEIPFWLALDCLMQRELCGRACLGRAPLDREAWVVGKKQEKMYIVVKGSACVVEASEGGGTPSGATMATEEAVIWGYGTSRHRPDHQCGSSAHRRSDVERSR